MNRFCVSLGALLLVFMFLSLPTGVFAAVDEEVLNGLQRRYDAVKTLTADFTQETFYKTLKQRDKAEGKVSFKKPGMMRWAYTVPVRDELISDGKTLWYYQPDLAQASEMDLADGPPAVATGFLMGGADFKKDFIVEKAEKKAKGAVIKLKPRSEQRNLKAVTLELDKDYTVVKAVIEDSFGGETTVSFNGIKVNKDVKDTFFTFKAPKGTVVIKQ